MLKFEGEVDARIWRGRRALDDEEGTWRVKGTRRLGSEWRKIDMCWKDK
jgi:hypothetical protein